MRKRIHVKRGSVWSLATAVLFLGLGQAGAATLDWNGGVGGAWQSGGSGWLNSGSPATWNNATPDAATFGGATPLAVNVSGAVTVGNLTFSSGGYMLGGTGTLTLNSGVIDVSSGLTAISSNGLAGSAGLTKTGAGTLVLANNNKTYTGSTTVSGGAIQITNVAANYLGSSAMGTIALDGGAVYGNFGANLTVNYGISVGASGGELRTVGSGRWLLAANKFTGSGTVTLKLASETRFQPAATQTGFTGKWIFDGGGSQTRVFDFNGGTGSGWLGAGSGDDVLTIVDSPTLLLRNSVILGTPSQGVTLGSGESKLQAAGGAVATIAGKLSGSAGNHVQFYLENAASVLIISNAANSWLGNTSVQGLGILRLGASGVFPDNGSTVDVFSSTATIDLNGFNENIGGLSGLGKVDNQLASSSVSLGVGGNGLDSTFSGTLTNSGASSSLQLVKIGVGTLTLAGTGIGHGGGTIISNGAIKISAVGAGRLGPLSTSAVTVNGGELQSHFSSSTTVGNNITVGANGGTIRNLGNDNQRWQFTANQLYGSGVLTLAFSSTNNSRYTLANAQNNFTGKWIIDSGGNVNRFVDMNYSSGNGFGLASGDDAITFEDNAGVLIREGLSLGSASQGITLGSGRAKITVASTSTGTVAGKISGPAANNVQFYLDNQNSVLIISNTANSWAGTTQINAGPGSGDAYGTLRLGAAGVLPDTGGTLEITSSGRLDLNGYHETIGGLTGAGRVDNMLAGSTATLTVGGNHSNVTFSGLITNSGASATLALTKSGTGTQTLSTANGYAGLTTVDAGALRISHADALGQAVAGTVVNSGATLELTGGITVMSEPLTLNGSGVADRGALRNISGVNIWDGPITLNNSSALIIASDSGDLKLRGTITQTGLTPPTFQGSGNIFIGGSMNGGFTRGSGAGDVLISVGVTVTGLVTVATNATGAFKVEGTLAGNVALNGGQLTGVNGVMDDVTVTSGLLSPGANGVTVLNMDSLTISGGAYQWNITNATGTAGVNWDLLRVGSGSGSINLSGAGTGSITVRVSAATALLPNFSHTSAGSWVLVDAGSVSGFAANKFVVEDSGFGPGSDAGTWSVSTSGGDLYINYAPGAPVDLAVRLSDSPDPAPVGDTITYTIVITNQSASAAGEYYVTNRLDVGMVYVGSSDSGSHSAGVIRWTLTNLAAQSSRTLTVTAYSDDQGNKAVVAEVWPRRDEASASDNRVTNSTSVYCPTAGLAPNNAPASRTATNGVSISFDVSSSNLDCNPPLLRADGLPSGAQFNVVTSGFSVTGTFLWPSPSTGTHPVRFYSFNETKATSTVVTLIYVNNGSEANNLQGIPVSQTNWHVEITDISTVSGGNATLVWESVDGITYDVYRSTGNLGSGGIAWSIVGSGLEADGVEADATVAASASQQYFQVVPQGKTPITNGVWAVIKPSLPPGFSTMAAPVTGSDLDFAGDFGDALADALIGNNVPGLGDEVFILQPNGTYSNLFLDASGVWRVAVGGTPAATTVLNPGQGFIVLNRQGVAAQPEFRGPVGNTGARTITIPAAGYTILGLSEGRHITLTEAFSTITAGTGPYGSYDEADADMIIVLENNGSYTPIQRLPDGTWLNLVTFTTANSSRFTPGKAYWYYRSPSAGSMTIRF